MVHLSVIRSADVLPGLAIRIACRDWGWAELRGAAGSSPEVLTPSSRYE